MALRPGPGPVFVYEGLTVARRTSLYAMRAAFVGAILIGLAFVWHQETRFRPARQTASLAALAEYGKSIYFTVDVVFSVGWPLFIASLFRPDRLGRSLVIGSPAVGAFASMAVIAEHPHAPIRQEFRVGGMFWLLVHLLVAKCLFAATVSRFDRCLGRMPEHGEPRGKSKGIGLSDLE